MSSGSHDGRPATQTVFVERASDEDGRSIRRVVVENVYPQVDGGRFPVKRTVGESVDVTADLIASGHDLVAGVVKYRRVRATASPEPWREAPLIPKGNDVWTASFTVTEISEYEYTIEAWIDRFGTWLAALVTKSDAGADLSNELLKGAAIIQQAASVRLKPDTTYDSVRLKPDTTYETVEKDTHKGDVVSGFSRTDEDLRLLEIADMLRADVAQSARVAIARDPELGLLMAARPDRSTSVSLDRPLRVAVDREKARFSAWYEMFPRSCTADPSRGGSFADAEARLPDIASLGFDVLYLPPIHPIGRTHRKGRNNALTAAPGDPGSPWAIGSEAGGHIAVDPGLGTLDDFDRFVAAAGRLGLEIALDIAFQASPDHPWVREHPEWFKHRPDGSIQYAENPPKKYQDTYPFDFECADWRSLWNALRDVFVFWIGHGVRIFRIDNPHAKPFGFWEWVIADIRRRDPDTIFLSEAFTRPKVMRHLAKLGFNQSYTYFTWRNSAAELREYLTELTKTDSREYMRPNFFANTPDILHAYLQTGGRPAFQVRLILAATLSASYGIYSGFELCENVPVRQGSEEYLNSEKYEIRPRDWRQPGNLNELIARVNEIRREHPALHFTNNVTFHATENPAFLWFSKRTANDQVFVAANTDPLWMQHGRVQVPIWELGIASTQSYVVEDLLDGARYVWRGDWNYVRLDPAERMAHIFVIHD